MEQTYKQIAHTLDMKYVNVASLYVGWNLLGQGWHPFKRTFNKIDDVKNIDILRSIKNPKLYLPYPHSSWVDTYLIPYILLKNGLQFPITIAGNNLRLKDLIFRKLGCAIIDRDKPSNLGQFGQIRYIEQLFEDETSENRDVICYSEYTENGNENGQNKDGKNCKAGRNWDGRLQKMSPLPIISASQAYKKGVDVNIVLVTIGYEPYVPEECIFEYLMGAEFSKKWYYRKLAKSTKFYKSVDFINSFVFPRARNLTAHVRFYGPYPMSQFSGKTQDTCKFLEKEEKKHYMITPFDLWAASIPESNGDKERISSEIDLREYGLKVFYGLLNGLFGEKPPGRTYKNDEIMSNASELIEKLHDKVDLSLVEKRDILAEAKKSMSMFSVDDKQTAVKDEFLLKYHRNHVFDLLEN